LFDGKKRSVLKVASAIVDVPEIHKGVGQVTDVNDERVVLMDQETYETFECAFLEPEEDDYARLVELRDNTELWANAVCEYWEVVGKKIITRVILN
jgi:translation elongation factor P/translation initiation factor 5A